MSSIGSMAAEKCDSEELIATCYKSRNHNADILDQMPKRLCSDVHFQMCSNFKETEICVKNFANRCIPSIIRDIYLQKFAEEWKFKHELCHDGEIKEQFILHSACFKTAWKKDTSCKDLFSELKRSFVNLKGLSFNGTDYRNKAVEKHCW